MEVDWPTAAVLITAILGFGGTAVTAIQKYVPKRLTNGKGEYYAKAIDVMDLRARVPTLEHAFEKESQYTHDAIHDMRNKLGTFAMDQALMKQSLGNLEKSVEELLRHMRRRRREDNDQ